MSIVKGIGNKINQNQNVVIMRRYLNQQDGGRVEAFVLYVNNQPIDHTVSYDQAMAWYEHHASKIEHPANVLEVGSFATGQIYIREFE